MQKCPLTLLLLLFSGCAAIHDAYFGLGSPFDPSAIVAALDAGDIYQYSHNWTTSVTNMVKEYELYECGGYPDNEARDVNANVDGKPTMLRFYPHYHFVYSRYADDSFTYSFYEKDGALFAVYQWDRSGKHGFYRFNDESLMAEYLSQLNLDIATGNSPVTYAVPEGMLNEPRDEIGSRRITLY